MECVAYLRVSTDKQAEEGNGLDSQRRDIMAYAGRKGYVIKEWYVDDGYTGTNMNRPALQRLINDCCNKKVTTIISFKMDRLSRGMVDGLYIIEKIFIPNGVRFECVHDAVGYDNPMQQAYTQMMAVFSQLDKNTMMLRMRGGMLERVKKGYWMGGGNLPYCYSYDKEKGVLVPIKERKEQANRAIKLFLDGWSDVKIMNFLNYKNEITVRKILTSVVNVGMIPYKGEIYKGLHEPIFDLETFEMAQRVRESRRTNRVLTDRVNLLTGLCYCGECGCSMRYQKWGNKGHRIYCCSRVKGLEKLPNYNSDCKNELFWAKDIEFEVEKKIVEISLNFKMDDFEKKERKSETLIKQLEYVKSKLKRLYNIYAEGNDTVVEMITEMEEQASNLKEEITRQSKIESSVPEKERKYKEIKKIADVWENIGKQDKNKILKSIIDKVIIVNDNIEIVLKDF